MRIALITHQWPGVRLGGIGTYTLHCARALAEAGHEPHVFTLSLPDDVRSAVPTGVTMHEVEPLAERVRSGKLSAAVSPGVQAAGDAVHRMAVGALLCDAVRAAHAVTPFDLVEGPEYEGLMLPLTLRPLAGNVPVVVHIHSGSAIVHEAQGVSSTMETQRAEALELASLLSADACCAPSKQVLADTQRFCAAVEATVLALPFFARAAERTPGLRESNAVLFVGRLEMVKGAHLLPEAANAFLAQNPAAELRLAGPDTAVTPDPAVSSMAAWIRAKLNPAVVGRVHFLGEMDAAGMAREMNEAAFVIVPSVYDSYSYVCCEAMAAGLPVIVGDQIGATEVVGEAGMTFRRNDAGALAESMHRLFNDRALRQTLSEKATLRATTTLSIANTLSSRLAFYESVIQREASGGITKLSQLPARYMPTIVTALVQLTEFCAGISNDASCTPGQRLLAILENVTKGTGQPTRAMLYGAGRHTTKLLAEVGLWTERGHTIVGLIDDHPRFASAPLHLGLPVYSHAQMETAEPGALPPVIILSTDTFQEQFWSQTETLRQRGAVVFKLYE